MLLIMLLAIFSPVKVKVWNRQIKQVTCDKCATNFAYEMIRHADGDTVHVAFTDYNATRDRATRSGRRKSTQLLDREVEMTPCPTCGWVNEDLARTFGWYLYWPSWIMSIFVMVLALLAGGSACIIAWESTHGNPFWVGLMGVIFFPLLLWVYVGSWLRVKLMRPNRHYPQGPPVVPPGTPLPMLLQYDAAGQVMGYTRVPMAYTSPGRPQRKVVCHIQDLNLPQFCCRCLVPTRRFVIHDLKKYFHDAYVAVPVCSSCRGKGYLQAIVLWAVLLAASAGTAWAMISRPAPMFSALYLTGMAIVVVGSALYYLRGIRPYGLRVLDIHRGVVSFRPFNRDYIGLMVDLEEAIERRRQGEPDEEARSEITEPV